MIEGRVYRLRLVSGSANWAFKVFIQGEEHDDPVKMTIIARDGSPCQPIITEAINIAIGERYDVFVRAPAVGTYNLWFETYTWQNATKENQNQTKK